ncbi:MAG: hypothetical protein J6P09_04725 [Methanobrevibacter sp.]|nr:hypothetical protein [Methanobrevibacter sp.]
MVLARFFKDDELKEMVDLSKTFTRHLEVERIIEKYGEGFDTIYFDGRADGYNECIEEGKFKLLEISLIRILMWKLFPAILTFPLTKLKILKESCEFSYNY